MPVESSSGPIPSIFHRGLGVSANADSTQADDNQFDFTKLFTKTFQVFYASGSALANGNLPPGAIKKERNSPDSGFPYILLPLSF
jgi:hypothetical protein